MHQVNLKELVGYGESKCQVSSRARLITSRDDYCGRLNLLTPSRVKDAAAEIKTGESAPLDLPSDVPSQPAFGRQTFHHEIKALHEGRAYDE